MGCAGWCMHGWMGGMCWWVCEQVHGGMCGWVGWVLVCVGAWVGCGVGRYRCGRGWALVVCLLEIYIMAKLSSHSYSEPGSIQQ